MSGIELISRERQRQVEEEGWTPEHDANHRSGELALAAVCYASCAAGEKVYTKRIDDYLTRSRLIFNDPWPWNPEWDKRPSTCLTKRERIRMLEKAGALIAAEIDRLLNGLPVRRARLRTCSRE